jgi:hypothetical protein
MLYETETRKCFFIDSLKNSFSYHHKTVFDNWKSFCQQKNLKINDFYSYIETTEQRNSW